MSLVELKKEVVALSIEEQAELAAFLSERLRCEDPSYQQELRRLLDDCDPHHWIPWHKVKTKAEQ